MQINYNSLSTKIVLFYICLSFSFIVNAQVGIGTTTPDAQLDVVSNATTGNTLQVNDENTSNTSSSAWIRNYGLGRGINIQNLNTSNTLPGIQISQLGTGNGLYNYIEGSGTGIFNEIFGTGYGLYNYIQGPGNGIYNAIDGTGAFGIINDLTHHGGVGSSTYLGVNNGTGYYVEAVNDIATPTTGGNVFAFDGRVYTSTPSGALVSGGVFIGEQYGLGHGILVNHYGTQGTNAEFNINNSSNTDAAIFAVHLGQGSSVLAQNQSNNITGTIAVGDFAYTGTDVADHIGVSGTSTPASGWGIGVEGIGNWYGVFSTGDFGATGAKTFLIDHPQDPANKMLKHFSIESNEVLNMYRGTDDFDADGRVVVNLPDYYDSINKNPSYQLTPIGAAMPNLFIESEVDNGQFIIAGGIPGKKVSWQITAERNDPYLQQNPEKREVVVDKEGERRGKYLTPELYGQPKEKGMNFREQGKRTASKLQTEKRVELEKELKLETTKNSEEEIKTKS